MTFANPLWLLLLLLAVPIALLHNRNRRTVRVPSVHLWRRIVQETPPRPAWKPPRPNRLLALQLLALASIAFALARPHLRESATDHWIIVLDASAEMQAPEGWATAFEAAAARLRRRLEGEPAATRISLIRTGGETRLLAARYQRPDDVALALDEATATHAAADWEEAAALLPGLSRDGESTRITVLAGPAGAGDAVAAFRRVLPDAAVEAATFGQPVRDLALAGVRLAPADTPGRWRLTGRIVNRSPGSDAGVAELRVAFQPTGTSRPLQWAAWEVVVGESTGVPFQAELDFPGAGVVELRVVDSGPVFDDVAHFVIKDAVRIARVLYVGSGNFVLERALEAVDGVVVERANALPDDAADYDLVVLDGVVPDAPVGTSTLWLGVAPGTSAAAPDSLGDRRPDGWRTDHPLARSAGLAEVRVHVARPLPRIPGADVLLESGGVPLIQARTTNAGREVFIAFAFRDSNWPQRLGFPAFVANLIEWVVPEVGRQVADPCRAGQPCELDHSVARAAWRILDPDGGEIARAEPSTNDPTAPLPAGTALSFTPDRAGLYTLLAGDSTVHIAVHADAPVGAAQEYASAGVGGMADARAASDVAGSRPWWKWLIVAAIVTLILEGLLAGLTTERFLLRAALARGAPLAGRRRAILALRICALSLLAFGLARLPLPTANREAYAVVVALADDPTRPDAERAGDDLVPAGAGWSVGAVNAVGSGRVTADIGDASPRRTGGGPASTPTARGAADVDGALALAAAMIPPGGTGRIVLTAGDGQMGWVDGSAMQMLRARGVSVDVMTLATAPLATIFIERIEAPARLRQDEPARLRATVRCECTDPIDATVRILRNGEVVDEWPQELRPGANGVEAPLLESEPGTVLHEIEVETTLDVATASRRAGVLVEVLPPARIAIITPERENGQALERALAQQGLDAIVLAPADAFPVVNEADRRPIWPELDVALLMNVPAEEIPEYQLEALEPWIRDTGGGLVIAGGENAFGPGGYFESTLETISPLSSEIPPDAPKAAVVFVLDRSGSMIQAEGTGTRLQIARQATMEAVSLLEEGSLAGVVAFDSAADVVAPIREATDTAAFREQLQRLIALGGTAIYPGLELAFEEMKQVDPLYARHIVVMTDGLSRPGDFEGLLADIVAQGITVSAVAIGSAADTRLVSMIAELGGGAYHATEDFTALPQILTEETSRFTSEPVKEVTVDPTWRERSADYLAALPDDLPPLAGYVLTTAKPGAELHLVGPQDLPILASWRYGVGRVVAFASHAAGSWAAEWMADPAFPAWWAQIVRSALPGTAGPGLHANLRVDGTNALLTVEAIARDGSPREGLALTTVVAGPDGRRMTPLRLTETAPGTYTARFSVDSNGEYRAAVLAEETVTAIGGDAAIAPVEARAYVSLADGSGARPIAPEVFTAIARQTGGRVLEPGDALLPAAPGLRWSWKPAWPAWALLALGVFLVELLLRYRPAFGIPSIRRAARGSMA